MELSVDTNHRRMILPVDWYILTLALRRKILFAILALGFIGPALLALPVGPFHIFPFRILIVLFTPFFLIDIFRRGAYRQFTRGTVYRFNFFLIWLVYAVGSAFWSPSMIAAIMNLTYLGTGILVVLMMVYYLSTPSHLLTFMNLWIGVFALFLTIGLWEIATGNHLSTSGLFGWDNPYPELADYVRIQFMPSAVFRNPNDYATFLMLGTAMLLVWSHLQAKTIYRLAAMLLLLIGLFELIYTESRANYFGVALIFFAWIVAARSGHSNLKFLGFLVVGLVGAILFLPNAAELFAFVKSEISSAENLRENVRLILYQKALDGLFTTYGFGLGAGGVEVYIGQFRSFTSNVTNVHNWWLEIAANYGIFIFTGYCVVYANVMLNAHRVFRTAKSKIQSIAAQATFLGLLGLVIGSISSSTLIQFLPYWMFLGFGLAAVNTSHLASKGSADAYIDYPRATLRDG